MLYGNYTLIKIHIYQYIKICKIKQANRRVVKVVVIRMGSGAMQPGSNVDSAIYCDLGRET